MYSFIVFLHVLSAFVFLIAHGVSIVVFFLMRRQPSVERTHILMSLRKAAKPAMMIAFLVMILAGLAAAFMGRWWGRGWPWASVGVMLFIFVMMGLLGREYFERIRKLIEPASKRASQTVAAVALHTQELTPVLRQSHPRLLASIGIGGLAAILYLMIYKPF